MDKLEVSRVLDEMATLLELMDANPFRVRAFQNGARVMEGLSQNLETLVREKKLITLKGIGEGLAHIITELVQKGKSREHGHLKKKVPDSVLEMLTIQGLGPQKVNILYKKLKIKTIHALETACKKH